MNLHVIKGNKLCHGIYADIHKNARKKRKYIKTNKKVPNIIRCDKCFYNAHKNDKKQIPINNS